jgi:hypothetical protein
VTQIQVPERPSRSPRPLRVRRRATLGLIAATLAAVPWVSSAGATGRVASPATVAIPQFPVQGHCWYSDTYGAARPDGSVHLGVDIIATVGHRVYAVDGGTLTKQYLASSGVASGNGWRLTKADGTYFFFAQMATFAAGLKVGSSVKVGQILGTVGATGTAGTPHLHFEVHPAGGAAVNPTPIVRAIDGCSITTIPPQPTTTTTTTTIALPPAPPTTNGRWQFITPVKAFDSAGKPLKAGSTTTVKVAGLTGVPTTVTGVMVRAVGRNAVVGGNVLVAPCGVATAANTMPVGPKRLNAITTIVKVTKGVVCLKVSTALDVRLDVVGVAGATGVGSRPSVARRALDTRLHTPLAAGATLVATKKALGVAGTDKAVSLVITLLEPSAAGSLGVGRCGGTPWVVPFAAQPAQVLSLVVVTAGHDVCISSTSKVHVVVDATGVWAGTATTAPYGPLRVYDSRSTSGRSVPITTATAKPAIRLPKGMVRGQLVVTLVTGANASSLKLWPCTSAKPTGSVVYAAAKSFQAVFVMFDASKGGLCMSSDNSAHVTIDVVAAG